MNDAGGGAAVFSLVSIGYWNGPEQKTDEMSNLDRRFSIAPMMDWTDRHCRYFHRLLTKRALLFTEMVTSAAVVHGDRQRLLGFAEVGS